MKNSLVLISLLFFISCSNDHSEPTSERGTISNPEYGIWQDKEEPIEFNEIQRFGSKDANNDGVLAGITAFFTDQNQNIYVLDNQQSKLKSFDKNGELRWVTGSKGRGPGDFENAWNMVWDGSNTIYVSNIARSRIDLFNLDGQFLNTLSTGNEKLEGVNIHGFIEEKLVVSRSISGSFAKEFMLINPEKPDSIASSFIVDITGELKIPEGMSWFTNVSVSGDQLVIAGMSDYSYTFYKDDSTKTKKITRNFNKIMRAGFFQNDEGRVIGSMGGLNPFLKVGTEYYVSSASWPTNIEDPDQYMKDLNMGKERKSEYKTTIDIFDDEFKLLYSIESEGYINQSLGLMTHVDNEGHVYSINFVPYPHIKKMSLQVND